MVREYGRGRMPLPCRSGWKSAYGPMPRAPCGSSRAGSSMERSRRSRSSPRPPARCRSRQLTSGPPVRRVERPWPYSWKMIPFSKSPSRIPGWSGASARCPTSARQDGGADRVAVGLGDARRTGSSAAPSSASRSGPASVRAAAGREDERLAPAALARAALVDVLAAGVAAGRDCDPRRRRARVVRGDAAVPDVRRTGRRRRRSWPEARSAPNRRRSRRRPGRRRGSGIRAGCRARGTSACGRPRRGG